MHFVSVSEAMTLTTLNGHNRVVFNAVNLQKGGIQMYRRVLSGMRTTGRLHLGHYVGALQNWLKYQNEYECYYLLADVQALTTHFDRVKDLEDSVRQVTIDWISVGLNYEHCSFVLQSRLRELFELTSYFTFLVKMGALEKNPTLKEEIEHGGIDCVNTGFIIYPISQAADILLFGQQSTSSESLLIPVGADQIPHIEFTRDVARAFNRQYAPVFTLPQAKLGNIPRLGDLSGDGKKMGKSYGNAIYLSDSKDTVAKKIGVGFTDPQKKRKGDAGDPTICPIYSYHEIFRSDGVEETAAGCRSGSLGCVECKMRLASSINTMLDPIRDKRNQLEQHPSIVNEAITNGTEKARIIASETIVEVRRVMNLEYPSLKQQHEK